MFSLDDTAAAGGRGIDFGPIHFFADSSCKQTWLTEKWTVRNCLVIPPRSPNELLDTLYEKLPLFRRFGRKLHLGEHPRNRHWRLHGPTG